MLSLLEYVYQEVDSQLIITKYLSGKLEGRLFPDKLSQTLQGTPKFKALSFIIGALGAIVVSSPDDLLTICIQDQEAT